MSEIERKKIKKKITCIIIYFLFDLRKNKTKIRRKIDLKKIKKKIKNPPLFSFLSPLSNIGLGMLHGSSQEPREN